MSIIAEQSGTAAGESGNYRASFPALRRKLWQWTERGEAKALQSGHAPHKGMDGERAFPEGWGGGWSCLRWHSTLTDCFSCAVAQTSLKIYSWQFPVNASFLSLQPHSAPAFPLPYFPSSVLFSPGLFIYKSYFTSQEIMTPTWYSSLICVPPPCIRTSAFPDAQPLMLAHHPRKSVWFWKNQTDHS